MSAFASDERHRVAVLVRRGLLPMELGLVHQLFRTATGSDGQALYEVVTCAPVAGDIDTAADFSVHVGNGPDALAGADTVLVPGATEDYQARVGQLDGPLAAAVEAIRPATRIASICTGAFVLAAAGLLDGRRATTHWKSCERFRRLYPDVDLDPDVLYTDNGDVLTSAGEPTGTCACT